MHECCMYLCICKPRAPLSSSSLQQPLKMYFNFGFDEYFVQSAKAVGINSENVLMNSSLMGLEWGKHTPEMGINIWKC